jgi:hypothetical protein
LVQRQHRAVALLGAGCRKQRVDRREGRAIALGVKQRRERCGTLIDLGRKVNVVGPLPLQGAADDETVFDMADLASGLRDQIPIIGYSVDRKAAP